MTYDCIVVGQGISGTFLSYYLCKAGKKVIVIDQLQPYTASRIASGVINPVTGRRIVKTWMIDELIPFCKNAYTEIGKLLDFPLVNECRVLDFYPTEQMQQAFEKRLGEEESEYLRPNNDVTQWNLYFDFCHGIGEISPALWMDIRTLLHEWRAYLQKVNALLPEKMDMQYLSVSSEKVTYKDISAKQIIFCDGASGAENMYFKNLPFALNKGEAIIAHIPGLPSTHIYKKSLSIVPWHKDENLFWIGSTYNWKFDDAQPTIDFREKVEDCLYQWLRLPYTILHHWASVRPANTERRPFVGFHPYYPNVGILNGMGTKGCSLGPYFAHQLMVKIVSNKDIDPLADVIRFSERLRP